MTRWRTIVTRAGLAAALSLGSLDDAFACSAITVFDPPEDLVRRATVIVRVKAVGPCEAPTCVPSAFDPGAFLTVPQSEAFRNRIIEFDVLETLKGVKLPSRVLLVGRLVEHDDFNQGDVPYSSGRSSFQCHARSFRAGAEYLWLLRPDGKGLTPYWAQGIASNEQLQPKDPWLAWVRNVLAGR